MSRGTPWAHCFSSRAIHLFTAYARYRLACVASVSVRFQSKERGTGESKTKRKMARVRERGEIEQEPKNVYSKVTNGL